MARRRPLVAARLARNLPSVRPDVTLTAKQLEARRAQVAAIAQRRRDAAYCIRGHLLQGWSVYVRANGRRQCLVCQGERQRERRAFERGQRQATFATTFPGRDAT
jgi:hypothetical protein